MSPNKLMVGAIIVMLTGQAEGRVFTSPHYQQPGPSERVQCVITNVSDAPIYVVPEWIECANDGTVTSTHGEEVAPGLSMSILSSDPRACRCRVVTDGAVSFAYVRSVVEPTLPDAIRGTIQQLRDEAHRRRHLEATRP